MGMPQLAAEARNQTPWLQAHTALSRLARQRAAADAEEGHWLLAAWRCSAHAHMGFGSFTEYVERLFGYKPRTARDKLRTAEALEVLPQTASALKEGSLSWSAAREITRVAIPETEQAWVDAARGKTLRQLEALVLHRVPGDTPDSPARILPRSKVLRFEVAPETFALFREAMAHLRRSTGGDVDDDGVLLTMARQVLAGPDDDGRSTHQISLEVCPACRSGAQVTAGELVPVAPEIVAMAECDAQHLGQNLPRAANENAKRNATEAARRDAHQGSGETGQDASQGTSSAVNGNPGTRSDPAASRSAAAHVGTSEPPSLSRATQSVPPALRRAILTRDRRCCRVPGCTNALFVDVHHIELRSEGGQHDSGNMLTLCSAHHRAVHRGELLIGRAEDGTPSFRHADGSEYGRITAPVEIDAYGKVFSALRNLGFRECDVKSTLSELRADADLANATLEQLLKVALYRIPPT